MEKKMLTEEDRQKIFNAIGGNEEETPEPEAPIEEQAVEAEPAPAEEEQSLDSEKEEVEEDHPHQIPYNRFRKVNEERKEFRELADEQSSQIEELQAQVSRLMQGTASSKDVEEVSKAVDLSDGEVDWEDWRNTVGRQMEELHIGRAQMELERELQAVSEKFPDVPQDAVLQAVANDGSVDPYEFAAAYSEFISDIREGAVANYVKENALSAKKSARPRVNSAGSSSAGEPSKPKTMEAAQAALLRHLKEM
tara:strand:+ start:418 stop:1170 length:753 start_codon:yes stop_codon:yes gene_type:complete